MGSIHRTIRSLGPAAQFSGLRSEREITQAGDRLLSALDPDTRRWADQQAGLLSKKPRFGVGEQAQLGALVATSHPKLDPVAKERLQIAVVYLALRASAPGRLANVIQQPAARTLFQQDILAG